MTAIQILKEQHRAAERLLDRILRPDAPAEHRQALLAELEGALLEHQRLEEELVYPAAKGVIEPLAGKAEIEHDLARRVLEELADASLSDEETTAKLLVLRDLLIRHVDVEEKEFFPKLETLLGAAKLDALEGELRARDRQSAPQLTAAEEAAAGHA